ncbi:MAG TPA: alpha/beta hydrolase [Anaerolineales bacterium]|nr:alpha/beta hydrolase [Anaerolineales bacterium]
MSAILLDNLIVHYEVLGRGRPVIFLHGWVGSWKYWISSMQVTSTSYRAYALDLWGFGDTAHSEVKYSLDEQVKLIDDFMNEMGIGKIAIVGHGLGALVGMNFALRYKNSVDRVMAINCPLSIDAVNSRLRTAPPQDLSDWLSNRTPEAATALSDASKADIKAIAASMAGLQSNNLFSQFKGLNIPTLLVYGEKDLAITRPKYEDTASTFIHQVVLDGSGHFPMVEEAAKFNRLLTDFLALDSGASPSEELQMKEEWKRRVR